MSIGEKTGTLNFNKHGNPNGSVRSNALSHVQRIGLETAKQNIIGPRVSDPSNKKVKRYAELAGNCKNHGIKSLWDNKTVTSKDFIDQMFVPAGSPLNTGNVPNTLLGFEPKMTTVSGNTAYFNHPSFLTVAFQQNLEISVHDQRVIGLRGDRVTADILWGVKQLDDERVVTIS